MRPRKTVRVLLLNPREELLLVKIDDPRVEDPGKPWLKSPFWVTLGGRIEGDETLTAAARREIREETGIEEVRIGAVVWYGEQSLRYKSELVLLQESFLIARTESSQFSSARWTSEEREVIREMRWWPIDELEHTSETILPPVLPTLIRSTTSGGFDQGPKFISLTERPNAS